MVKPIVLTDTETNEVFTLEFSRDSIKFAEQRGFKIEDVPQYPMSKIPELFFYAFRMHHMAVARERTDKILEKMGGLSQPIIERLCELYEVPFETLIADEGTPKNSPVTVEM